MPRNLIVFSVMCGWHVTLGVATTLKGQAPPISAILETRIGAIDGPMALGRVEALAVDPSGRVYVLESDEHRVRVFDRSGRLVHTLGRRGQGPGELADPVGLAWAPDTTLWIIDPGNNRASVYTTHGSLVRDQRLPSAFSLAPWPGRFDRAGNLYHYSPASYGDEFAYVMVKYDREMTPRDTVVLPKPPQAPAVFETVTDRFGVVRATVPFSPRIIWRLGSDGGLWWAWTAKYEIFAGHDTGPPVITSSIEQAPVTRSDREAALEGLQRFREVGGRVDPSRIPNKKPALRTFFFDDHDDVWVMPELATGETGRRLDWFDALGSLRASVDLPINLSTVPTPVVRDGWLYGVERDELGVPFVVVVRVSQ